MAGILKAIDTVADAVFGGGANCSNELNRLGYRQDETNKDLQSFYKNQQAVNQAAIQEFNNLRNRTEKLERQSDETRKFMKKQKKINRATAEALGSIQGRLNGEPRKKQSSQAQQHSKDTDSEDDME